MTQRSGTQRKTDTHMKNAPVKLHNQDAQKARGMDTLALIPVFAALYEVLTLLVLPWFSVPELKYTGYAFKANVLHMAEMEHGIAEYFGYPDTVLQTALQNLNILRIGAIIGVVVTLAFIVLAFLIKVRSALLGRIAFLWNALLTVYAFSFMMDTNRLINLLMGKPDDLMSYTLNSSMQLTPYAYSLVIFGIILVFMLEQLLDTRSEYEAEQYILKVETEDPGISKRTIVGLILVVVAIPMVIAFGILFLQDRSIYFISLSVMILSMVPFFLVFENRRPEAREIIVIAVMAALATVGRAAFFMLPFFKPVAAIVIISAVALGPEAGFLTGATAALVSNFLFGQGPWTPWQMFSFGIIGFIGGLIFRRYRHGKPTNVKLMAVYGFLATLLIYGPIMDTSTIVQSISMGYQEIDWEAALAIYAAGIPVNLVHATSSFVFIWFLANPLLKKLNRVKQKYGILEP